MGEGPRFCEKNIGCSDLLLYLPEKTNPEIAKQAQILRINVSYCFMLVQKGIYVMISLFLSAYLSASCINLRINSRSNLNIYATKVLTQKTAEIMIVYMHV